MQRLTGMDATFLYMETPTMPMHVSGTYILDPSTAPGRYGYDEIRAEVERRLHLLPPSRRRLVEVPFELHHPLWIEDPDFDLDHHLHRRALPAPGGRQDLATLAAEIHARPMDRSHPLWDLHVVEGLEGGLTAVIARTHHSAIDGATGVDITVRVLDTEPGPVPVAPPEVAWEPDRVPTDAELVSDALQALSRQPASAAKALLRTVETVLTIRRRNREPDANPPPAPFTAPRTSINMAITPRRSLGMAEISLDDVKMVRRALGGTVNDVILAVCAGALRHWFDDRGEVLDQALVAMCPISIRTADDRGGMGNQVSSMLTSLATDVDDPVERLRVIQHGTRQAKEQAGAIGAAALTEWAELAAPAVAARAARLYSRTKMASHHRPIFNVTISNVPGPNFPLYMAGARLVSWYPMGPIADGGGLNMTAMSYLGTIHFGLVACPDVVVDVQALADHLHVALEQLLKAAREAEAV